MNRAIQLFSLLLFLALASTASGQTPVTCGLVGVDGPDRVQPGAPIVFKAKVTSVHHISGPEFKWTVSLDAVVKGQGTEALTVDSTGLAGLVVTATVELIGALPGCTKVASKTTTISLPKPELCRFDSYGDIEFDSEKARLDNFAAELSNEPKLNGLIMMWAGQETFAKETEGRLKRIRSFLSGVRGIDSARIVTIDCGFSKELAVKLYTVPVGTAFPGCNEYTQVPFSEVKFTKPRPKTSKKKR